MLALRLRRRAFEEVLEDEPRIALRLLREPARRIRAMQASGRDRAARDARGVPAPLEGGFSVPSRALRA